MKLSERIRRTKLMKKFVGYPSWVKTNAEKRAYTIACLETAAVMVFIVMSSAGVASAFPQPFQLPICVAAFGVWVLVLGLYKGYRKKKRGRKG